MEKEVLGSNFFHKSAIFFKNGVILSINQVVFG